jgi:hypothetical protein
LRTAGCCDSLTPSTRICSYAAAVVGSSAGNKKGKCSRSSLYVVGDWWWFLCPWVIKCWYACRVSWETWANLKH